MRSAIIILLFNYCASLFSQDLVFTREFPALRKTVPLQIINNSTDYFFVLRYNKEGHDLTIEKRSKPDGEINWFIPLKLDSVNVSWFDYEKLDYLLCESQGKLFFFFEKYLNPKKAIYVKAIDANGKTNGFKELAFLEKDKTVNDYRFLLKQTDNDRVLIVGEQYYYSGTAKKVAMLYDLKTNTHSWIKKLPLENAYTGFSRTFECNARGDLFYVLAKGGIVDYKRKFVNHVQLEVPVFSYDSLSMVSFLNDSKSLNRIQLISPDSFGLKSISLYTDAKGVAVITHCIKQHPAGKDAVFFYSQKFTSDLSSELYSVQNPISKQLEKQLTFYDASDSKLASEKDYRFLEGRSDEQYYYTLSGRDEENYSKELLLWKTKKEDGTIESQKIIPRKIFYFDDRTRFKNIGQTGQTLCNGTYFSFLLEDSDNEKLPADAFDFHDFSRQKYLWGANLVAYELRPGGQFVKHLIYKNKTFDFVPLIYTSNQCDFVFYLTRGKGEKFAIYRLNPS